MEINQTHNGTEVNNKQEHARISHSHIEFHPDFNHGLRFGENSVNLAFDVVPSDKDYQFRCRHHINSYTLKAPLGQNVEIHKDYYLVPHKAILPFNSEKILQAPKTGDDVPENAGCVTRILWETLNTYFTDKTEITGINLEIFRYLWILQTFFSRGNLMNHLGYAPPRIKYIEGSFAFANSSFTINKNMGADEVYEGVISMITEEIQRMEITKDGKVYEWVKEDTSLYKTQFINFRDAINFIYDNIAEITEIKMGIDNETLTETIEAYNLNVIVPNDNDPFNYERLCSYALIQAQFYSNDNVDYVYNADMLKEYASSLAGSFSGNQTFEWNGINTPYDWLSAVYLNDAITDATTYYNKESLAYLQILFCFKRSLRFVDYFTGAHTRPLAVGEQGVAVQEGFVSAVDMAREMQRTKYLQLVEHSGRDANDYNESVFGVREVYDYHDPMWLASTSDTIYAAEVTNTGEAQMTEENSVTAKFTSNADRFAFRFNSNVYGNVIGIEYVDIKRVYTDIRDRSFFMANRYDRFIPEMQFIGDQPIYKKELGIDTYSIESPQGIFGYTVRDMQYKVAISRAVGPFDGFLPGWAFTMNPTNNPNPYGNSVISPDFIRARPAEFDEFYLKLSYYSLAGYFHFIVFQTSDIEIDRPMVMNPQILR